MDEEAKDLQTWSELRQVVQDLSIDPEKLKELVGKYGLIPCLRLGKEAKDFREKAQSSYGQALVEDAMSGKITAKNIGTYGLMRVLQLTTVVTEFGNNLVMNYGEPMVTDFVEAFG